MKVTKVTVVDDDDQEQELNVTDGTLILLCEDNKILTQTTSNAAINLEIMKNILNRQQ